jgi:hypothetical protein
MIVCPILISINYGNWKLNIEIYSKSKKNYCSNLARDSDRALIFLIASHTESFLINWQLLNWSINSLPFTEHESLLSYS